MRCCIASSTTSRLTDKHNQVSLAPQSNRRRWAAFGPPFLLWRIDNDKATAALGRARGRN
jgi:hypothetical protein